MARVLVVDDEPAIVSTVSYTLRREGYDVLTASDGHAALGIAQRERPELMVLDLMLPGLDGLEVCRAIRAADSAHMRRMPILVLSARGDEVDRIVGLEVGADDYLTKPFSMRELVARVKAALRRVELDRQDAEDRDPVEPAAAVAAGEIQLDPGQRRAWRKKKELKLKPKEFELLAFFLHHPGQVLTRDQLLDQVWGRDFIGDERTVDVHVRWLREKIEKHPNKPKVLETVRGVGYRLRLPKKGEKAGKAEKAVSAELAE